MNRVEWLIIDCLQDDKSGHLQHGIREKNIKFVWGNPDKFEVNKRFKEISSRMYYSVWLMVIKTLWRVDQKDWCVTKKIFSYFRSMLFVFLISLVQKWNIFIFQVNAVRFSPIFSPEVKYFHISGQCCSFFSYL